MSYQPMRCVDCPNWCSPDAYRCRPCANKERGQWIALTGQRRGKGFYSSDALAKGRATRAARLAETRSQRAAQFIADIEDDFELGIEPERIAADLGIKIGSVATRMYRLNRPDLAVRFVRSTRRDRYSHGDTCGDCGQLVSNGAERCRPCANSRSMFERHYKTSWSAA